MTIIQLSLLGTGIVVMLYAFQKKNRLAMALGVFCLLVGIGLFAAEPAVPAAEAQSKPSAIEAAGESSISQVELGGQLFVAKGCITCHTNNKVAQASEYWMIEAGPNLTSFSAAPEVLRMRLEDPSQVKSDTQMPNLNLSEAEIEALIAFINSK